MTALRTAAGSLLCASLASCDRPPHAPPPPGQDEAAPAGLAASDPACALPLRHFAPSKLDLVESMLDYPTNRLIIDRSGRLLWNAVPVGRRRLEQYLQSQERIRPPVVLVVTPARDSPCAAVREALSAALRFGRCRPDRCAFEWPGTRAPPPPAATGTGSTRSGG